MAKKQTPTLLVFSDDWGRHPSSCQHLMSRLLGRYPIYWVNTIGMRTPSFDLATVKRGLEKFGQWFRKKETPTTTATGPHVLNPRMWPRFTTAADRWLNHKLLVRQLKPVVQACSEPVIAVTTIPIVADLMGRLPVQRWVYYCVDDFGQWPGLDQATMHRMEAEVIDKADVLIAVSETLQEKLAQRGKEAHLLTHGVDVEFWHGSAGEWALPANLQHPLIVFWGVVDRRLDTAFLRALSQTLTEGTILLVGPGADPDPELLALDRVVHLGPVAFEQLPQIAREAAVLVMPYADLPVTRAMQPLKFKEYLATGKPAVVRDLPATQEWRDSADLTDSPQAFARAVLARLESGLPEAQRLARARLVEESWDSKARLLETWIHCTRLSLSDKNVHPAFTV